MCKKYVGLFTKSTKTGNNLGGIVSSVVITVCILLYKNEETIKNHKKKIIIFFVAVSFKKCSIKAGGWKNYKFFNQTSVNKDYYYQISIKDCHIFLKIII